VCPRFIALGFCPNPNVPNESNMGQRWETEKKYVFLKRKKIRRDAGWYNAAAQVESFSQGAS
jgi:hypothetical protein